MLVGELDTSNIDIDQVYTGVLLTRIAEISTTDKSSVYLDWGWAFTYT